MNSEHRQTISRLPDETLLRETARLAQRERVASAELITALAEIDARKLYLGQGCASLFAYCTGVLHLSEDAAAARISAARVAQLYPSALELLSNGSLTLTAVTLLRPVLTRDNHATVFHDARGRSKRQVEQLIAALQPQADVPSTIRRLPAPSRQIASTTNPQAPPPHRPAAEPNVIEPQSRASTAPETAHSGPAPVSRGIVAALAPNRYKLQVTLSQSGHDHLRRAQDLLRHVTPNGDPAAIVERALDLLVKELERRKFAAVEHPRGSAAHCSVTRHVPADVKRAVAARDEGHCAFVGAQGRCTERGFLEFHHVVPFAEGGTASADNLQLRCRAHNGYEADLWFGEFVREVSPRYGEV